MPQWQSQTRKMNNHYQSTGGDYIPAGVMPAGGFQGVIRGGKVYRTPYVLYEEGSSLTGRKFYKTENLWSTLQTLPLIASGKLTDFASFGDLYLGVYDLGTITPSHGAPVLSTAYSFTEVKVAYKGGTWTETGESIETSVASGEVETAGLLVPVYHAYMCLRVLKRASSTAEVPSLVADFPEVENPDSYSTASYLGRPYYTNLHSYNAPLAEKIFQKRLKLFKSDVLLRQSDPNFSSAYQQNLFSIENGYPYQTSTAYPVDADTSYEGGGLFYYPGMTAVGTQHPFIFFADSYSVWTYQRGIFMDNYLGSMKPPWTGGSYFYSGLGEGIDAIVDEWRVLTDFSLTDNYDFISRGTT